MEEAFLFLILIFERAKARLGNSLDLNQVDTGTRQLSQNLPVYAGQLVNILYLPRT